MTTAQIEAGTLTANLDDRTVTGLLVPYGEEGNSNLGRFAVEKGAFTIPRDPSIVAFADGHEANTSKRVVIGRAEKLTDTDAGVVATFRIADTDEGDSWLLDAKDGKKARLSAEVANVVLRAGKAVAGVLFGAAAVEKGAFPSAALMAEDVGDLDTAAAEISAAVGDTEIEPIVREVLNRLANPETPEAGTPAEEPLVASATTPEEDAVPTATAPDALHAATTPEPQPVTAAALYAALAAAKRSGDRTSLAPFQSAGVLFAELSDITGATGANAVQPQFIGELWGGKAYERKIVPLFGHADLTSMKINGWRWTTKPKVAPYSGNKTAVPSNAVATEAYSLDADRLAGAHDVDRKFRDFGDTAFLDSYFRAMTESYARESDALALADVVAAATEVEAGTVPSGIADGLAYIIDGALAVVAAEASPSFAIVGVDLWRDIMLTPKNDILGYLEASLSLEEGSTAGFRIIPSGAPALEGSVLVGAREAATVYELPGNPIRVEGLDIANAGIDPALFGYIGTVIHDDDALALVTAGA